MKRVKLAVLLGIILVLGACSKSPKEEFIASYDSLGTGEYNAGKFEATITDFKMNQTSGAAWAQILNDSLKNMTFQGDYQFNEKDSSFSFNAAVEAFGTEMPLDIVGNEEKFYVSTSFVDGMFDMMDSFGFPIEADQTKIDELAGKYIEVDMDELAEAAEEDTDSSTDAEEMGQKMTKILEDAKEESFKADGDKVSHTFTSADLVKISKNRDLSDEAKTTLENSKMTMQIDKKTKKTNCTIKMSEDGQEMTMKLVFTPSKNDKAIKLPKEKDLVPEEELNNFFQEMNQGTSNDMSDYSGMETLSDEEFEFLYQQAEASLGEFDDAQKQEIIKGYTPYMTEEQAERFKALLASPAA